MNRAYLLNLLLLTAQLFGCIWADLKKSAPPEDQESRAPRQVYSGGFANDFFSSSVDLNQDGQPDNQQLFYNGVPGAIGSSSSFTAYPYSYPNYPSVIIPIADLSDNITFINDLIANLTNQLKASQNQITKLVQQITVIQTPQSLPAVRVSFHGQRSSSSGELSTPGKIPYDKALTNNGNGLNLSSGVFTAPLDGLYYFAWTGESSTETLVYLDSSALPNDHLCSTYTSSAHQALKCHAIVNLKKGDQVWASLANYKLSGIFDQNLRYTNFIGNLLG